MAHSLGQNLSVLRHWAHHSDTALPADWHSFARENASIALNIEREDPVLVSLLSGNATASVTADAIEGKLAAKPESYGNRMKAQQQARMQYLSDNNPYKTGNLTEVLEVHAANPELAERLKKEAGVGDLNATPSVNHQRQVEARTREARVEAMNRSQARVRSWWPA